MPSVETLIIKTARTMLKDTRARVDSKKLDRFHLCYRFKRLHHELDIVEESIIGQMRLQGPNAEFIDCLIGERENIRYKLKEVRTKLHDNKYAI